jgi:hypothetical protein
VVRGGSWNNNPANVRSAARNNNHPDNRNNNIGFRVLCLSHIVMGSCKAPLASPELLVDQGLPAEAWAFSMVQVSPVRTCF